MVNREREDFFAATPITGGNSPPPVVYYAHLETVATPPENWRR
jgi:hypothetical protein